MKKIVLFLLRKKLNVKKCEGFQFVNQSNKKNWYFIDDCTIWKVIPTKDIVRPSNVSLNYIFSNECNIYKTGDVYDWKKSA